MPVGHKKNVENIMDIDYLIFEKYHTTQAKNSFYFYVSLYSKCFPSAFCLNEYKHETVLEVFRCSWSTRNFIF